MKRLRLALRVAFLGVAVALPVSADAPISQYAAFDGNKKTITDVFTHLVWERPAAGPDATYPDVTTFALAQQHCADLTLTGSAGSMRLPTMKELLTIVDEDPHDEYDGTKLVPRYVDKNAFHNTPAEEFWTSSMADATRAYTVDFSTGATSKAQISGDSRRVRCVDFQP